MTAMSFDFVNMIERLEEAGTPAAQAKAHATLLAEAFASQDAGFDQCFASKHEVASGLMAIHVAIDQLDAKFDARLTQLDVRLDTKIAQLDAKFDTRIDQLDAKLNTRIDQLDAKLDAKVDQLDAKICRLEIKLDKNTADVKTQLILWVAGAAMFQITLIAGMVLKLAH